MNQAETNQASFLAACLAATLQPVEQKRLAETAAQFSDWTGIENLAEEHAVAPLVYSQIKDSGLAVPKPQRNAFAALTLRHRRAHAVRSACVEEMLAAFDSQSINVLVLKGVALAHLAYADPSLRPMRDVDLLLNKHELPAAQKALREIGYNFADNHRSRFMGEHHHLPEASKIVKGLNISVELHHDALSPDSPGSLTLSDLTEEPQHLNLDSGRKIAALGHVDMLHHICRHAFEPSDEVRLIHLYDIVSYIDQFAVEIDWSLLLSKYPTVPNSIACIHYLLPFPDRVSAKVPIPTRRRLQGVGKGMKPLSEILHERRRPFKLFTSLFDPPAWWLHGYYGIHPDQSLAWTRGVRHPLTVARWLARRAAAISVYYRQHV